jgi:N-acetylmuramoyl-L-alanine amidase
LEQYCTQKADGISGLKVALDPGHLGGEWAEMEARYVKLRASQLPTKIDDKTVAQFNEGAITFYTAQILSKMLKAQGASTLITRESIGLNAAGDSFRQWYQDKRGAGFLAAVKRWAEDYSADKRDEIRQYWLQQATEQKIFEKLYLKGDLNLRVNKINNWAPHLTLIIHYNAGAPAPYRDSEGYNLTTSDNYNTVFIPGSFAEKELDDLPSRAEFVRLLVTPDIEDSRLLAHELISEMSVQLAVRPMTGNYLDRYTLPLEQGVYARNLALTRLIHGPLAYGETLFQDNVEEAVRLLQALATIERDGLDNVVPDNRIHQVAMAYFKGIKNLLEKKCQASP